MRLKCALIYYCICSGPPSGPPMMAMGGMLCHAILYQLKCGFDLSLLFVFQPLQSHQVNNLLKHFARYNKTTQKYHTLPVTQ